MKRPIIWLRSGETVDQWFQVGANTVVIDRRLLTGDKDGRAGEGEEAVIEGLRARYDVETDPVRGIIGSVVVTRKENR